MNSNLFSDQYFESFDALSQAIYLCWQNSFCETTELFDHDKLRTHVRSFGFYPQKINSRKIIPLCFRTGLNFNTLIRVKSYNDSFLDEIDVNEDEIYAKAIKEIEKKLFHFNTKSNRIAYANVILRKIDKSYLHKNYNDSISLHSKIKELISYMLDNNFICDDNVTFQNDCDEVYPIYDLSVRLIHHFDFIDKLIELFLCFDICLLVLAEKANCNLYLFKNRKFDVEEIDTLQPNIFPKFDSGLVDDCLIKVMHHLTNKNQLEHTNIEDWLFWFNRQKMNEPKPLNWKGSPSMLTNVIQHLSKGRIASTLKIAFCTNVYAKPTLKAYKRSRIYKEIEQIITIYNQKNS